MFWLPYSLILLLVHTCTGENETAEWEAEITAMVHDATADVLAEYDSSRPGYPPDFNMPDDFMRPFQPATGVGNREELEVTSVKPLDVYADASSSRFLFKHFNNTDYLAGVSDNSMTLYKISTSAHEYLELYQEDYTFVFDSKWPITDVVLFTQFEKNIESLYVAIVVENERNSAINVYAINGGAGELVTVISTSSFVKKISYVQSSYGGYLTLLLDTKDNDVEIRKQQGKLEVNSFLEVKFPFAVDFVAFTVHGHGYIAVANNDYCDIFKLDRYAASPQTFDRLGLFSGIVDLEYFRLGFHHYLAVTDSMGHHLYTWKKGEFAPKQNLAIPDVAQVYAAPVESCRDEVILMTLTNNGSLHFHVFNGQTEKFEAIYVAVPGGYNIKPGSITSFTYQGIVVIVFVDFSNEQRAFIINTSLIPLKDPFLVHGAKVAEAMKDLQDKIERQNMEIKRIKDVLKDAVRKTGNQHITAFQFFDYLTATDETEVESVNEFELKWEGSSLTSKELKEGTEELENNVEYLERLVKEMENKISDVVRLDEDSVITGKKIFTGHVSADTLVATSVDLSIVAGMDLLQIQKDVYRLDSPEFIDGTLTFSEPLTITKDLHIERTMNGIDIDKEVMTTNTEQSSQADMVFMNKLTINGDLEVYGKVNDIDVSEEVVTLTGKHHIYGKKIFRNGIEARNVHTSTIDGVDIDYLYEKAFTVSGNQTILEDAHFSSVTTNNIILSGLLNGYNIAELADNIVRTDRPTTITESKNFVNDVVINGDLMVHGTVNGLRIPDDLVLKDRHQTITGYKEFVGHVTARDVNVDGKIDGLRIPEDVVTLSGDEEISSTLYFADGIEVKKNIIVEELVDGIDISEVEKQAIKLNETNEFENAVFLSPVTITGNLNVAGTVNDVNLNEILRDVVYKDDKPIEIAAKKYFEEVTANKINLDGTINGFNISIDFMKTNADQYIDGIKTFRNVAFNSIHIESGMIGDVDIEDLYQRKLEIVVKDDLEVSEQIEFIDDVVVEDLTVRGMIDGIDLHEIVLVDSDQPISNKHFAEKVIVDNLIIDGDLIVDYLNEKNLTEFYNNRVTLSGDQIIYGDIWLGNVTADKVSIAGFVNGYDINVFANNIMSKTKPQVLTGSKEFSGDVLVSGDIRTSQGVNGYNLADINRRAFKLQGPNEVSAVLEFEDNVTFNNLTVGGYINGINLTRLNEDSLKKTAEIQYVQGDAYFLKGFDVIGDIMATKVNGLVLQEDVLLNTIKQTITGHFTFDNVGIGGNLTINGRINGLDLSEVASKLARLNDHQTVIESDITFTSEVYVSKDIEVTGTVNKIKLKELFDNVLRKTGDQVITGHKVIRGNVTILGDLDVKYVNGIPWNDFLGDVVWIDTPQVIHSPKTFSGDVSAQNMFVSGAANARLVNGGDLKEFFNDVVFIDEPAHITGPVVFKHPVEITGNMNADLINGLNLKTDVITLECTGDPPQRITGRKIFRTMKVMGDIYTPSVNSLDLRKLYEDTLLKEGDQTVTGHKIIYGDVTFKSNVYPNVVNGMNLSTDLVTLHTEQTIKGPLQFQGDVFVKGDLIILGNLNGVELLNLEEEAVYLGTDQEIGGSYSFENVKASNVMTGTVNGMDLSVLDRNITDFLNVAGFTIKDMEHKVQEHCELARDLQEVLENSYYALDSFVTYQELDYEASFIKVESDKDITLVYLNDTATSAIAVLNVWDENTRLFKAINFSITVIAKSLQYRTRNISLTVNTGINSKDSSVVVEQSGYSFVIDKGFSNASVIQRKTDIVVALLFPFNTSCKIYCVKGQTDYTLDVIDVGKEGKSIVLFETSHALYLAVSSSYSVHGPNSKIYVNDGGKWRLYQRSVRSRGSLVHHFTYHGYHYLIFTNDAPVHESKEPKSLQVYRNTDSNGKFVLFQKISFDDTRGMDTFEFGDSSQLHLVAWNATVIQIFGLEGESGFKQLVTIHADCVRDVKPLFIKKDLYLIVGQQSLMTSDTVKSVLYKGKVKGVKYDPYEPSYC